MNGNREKILELLEAISSDEWQIEEQTISEDGTILEVKEGFLPFISLKPLKIFHPDQCDLSFLFFYLILIFIYFIDLFYFILFILFIYLFIILF